MEPENNARLSPTDPSDVRAPIIIGVTGHRDIPEEAKSGLRDRIKALLLGLKATYPNTTFVLLSALAEGADQLAARVALMEDVQLPLYAILPMPCEYYERDFEDDALAGFRELLAQAASVTELPLVKGNTLPGIAAQGRERDLQYESVGKYIVERSEILIALWDGTDNGKIAGTAAVVRFQREGIPSADSCNIEPPESFPVYHILTPRKSNPNPVGAAASWLYASAFGSDAEEPREYYDRIFSQIERFNSYVANPSERLRAGAEKSRQYLLGENAGSRLFDSCERDLSLYCMADALALQFQRARNQTQKLLHVTVWAAFTALVLFSHTPHHHTEYLVVAFIIFATAYIIHRVARNDERDANYQDYRALAEGLRVELFWRAAGLPDFVEDYYLWKQRTELDWIRAVLRGWNIRKPVNSSSLQPAPVDRLEEVRKCWVEDQLRYFRRAAEREEIREEKTESIGNMLVVGAIVLSVLLLFSLWIADAALRGTYDVHESFAVNLVLIFVEALLAGGAIYHHYADRMAYAVHAKQYARMALVFSRASQNIQKLLGRGDAASALHCFRKLGKEALAENGDWVQLHRERPLEMPHP